MIVYVNSKYEIKDVNTTNDKSLLAVKVPEDTFKGWPIAKICCFKVILNNGYYVGYTPYIDSKVIEHIERLAKKSEMISDENAILSETLDSLLTDIIPSLLG